MKMFHAKHCVSQCSSRPAATRSAVLLFLAFLSLCLWGSPIAAQVHFDVRYDSVVIQINGKPFSVLYYGKEARKPFLHPLLTASGNAVTRGFPVDPLPGESTDRPNHRGLTIGTARVQGPETGLNAGLFFWGQNFVDNDPSNMGPDRGTIAFKELTGVVNGEDRGVLSMVSHWISHQGQLWLIERRKMTFYSKPADCRVFDIDLELEAAQQLTFSDYQDSMLALRLGLPFDSHYGGKIVNASGGVNEEGVRGRRSTWIDWTTELNSGEKVGVAIFDHPANLNYPARWQYRDKGIVGVGPFAGRCFAKFDPTAATENAEYTMKRGDKLHLRYRIVIHPAGLKLDNFLKEFTSP